VFGPIVQRHYRHQLSPTTPDHLDRWGTKPHYDEATT
jgi:hypothetical protein